MAAGCGGGSSEEQAAAPAPTETLTPYQRAYPVICEGAPSPEEPPTDAPTRDPRPLVEIQGWAGGFCQGEQAWAALEDSPFAGPGGAGAQMVEAAKAGDRARQALVADPPRCSSVAGTPAEPFCP